MPSPSAAVLDCLLPIVILRRFGRCVGWDIKSNETNHALSELTPCRVSGELRSHRLLSPRICLRHAFWQRLRCRVSSGAKP